jgi:hypothetical protein
VLPLKRVLREDSLLEMEMFGTLCSLTLYQIMKA